jgi:WD40 repeat protein
MQQPDVDGSSSTVVPAGQLDAVISSVLCFSVADGSLLQQLPQPHGASAVSHFCLDAAGAVLATCGADNLIKLWSIGGGSCTEGLPVSQSFTAHRGAVAGVFVRVRSKAAFAAAG